MRLRYAGACRVCGVELPAKVEAIYERTTKTVRCVSHDVRPAVGPAVVEVVESGTAGASARREFERRKAKREERIRTKHPKLGGLMLAVSDEQQSTTAWDIGALGEERLGKGLDRLVSDTLRLLHDRRIPRSKANIDHLAVTASGVYVIDAKKYRGVLTSRSMVASSGLALNDCSSVLATAPNSSTECSSRLTSCAACSTTMSRSTVCSVLSKQTGH